MAGPTTSGSSPNSSPRLAMQGGGPSVSGGGSYLPSNLGRTVSSASAAGKGSGGGAPPRLSTVASSAFSDVSDMQLSRLASSLQASSSISASQGEELLLQHLRSGDPSLFAALAAGPPGLSANRRSADSSSAYDLQLAAISRSVSTSSGGMVHVQVTTGAHGGTKGDVVICDKYPNRNASLLDLANATMAAASYASNGLPLVRRTPGPLPGGPPRCPRPPAALQHCSKRGPSGPPPAGLGQAAPPRPPCRRAPGGGGRRWCAGTSPAPPCLCIPPAHHHPPPPSPQGATTEEIQRRLQTLELLAAVSGQDGQRPISQLFQMPTIVSGLQNSQGGADPAAGQQHAASPTPTPTEVQAN
jgi:hypothetical protein